MNGSDGSGLFTQVEKGSDWGRIFGESDPADGFQWGGFGSGGVSIGMSAEAYGFWQRHVAGIPNGGVVTGNKGYIGVWNPSSPLEPGHFSWHYVQDESYSASYAGNFETGGVVDLGRVWRGGGGGGGSTEQEFIEVLIWPMSQGDVGHTAIKIDGLVFGYYPTDLNGDGAYTKEDLSDSPGDMHIDNAESFSQHYRGNSIHSYKLSATHEQKSKVLQKLNQWTRNPGTYSLFGNNCTSVAINCLRAGNLLTSFLSEGGWSSPNSLIATLTVLGKKPTIFIVK